MASPTDWHAPNTEEILTLTEIARHLRVSERTILRMLDNEDLPGGKVGGQWRFSREAVDTWLTSRIEAASAEQLVDVVATQKQGVQRIPDLLPPERIVLHLQPGDKERVLRQLVQPVVDAKVVRDADAYLRTLIQREELCSTAIGGGIALPHARDPRVVGAATDCLALGLSREGLDFDALDGQPTHIVLLVCATSISAHLRLMAKVSLMLRLPGLTKALRLAETKDAVRRQLLDAHADLSIRL